MEAKVFNSMDIQTFTPDYFLPTCQRTLSINRFEALASFFTLAYRVVSFLLCHPGGDPGSHTTLI